MNAFFLMLASMTSSQTPPATVPDVDTPMWSVFGGTIPKHGMFTFETGLSSLVNLTYAQSLGQRVSIGISTGFGTMDGALNLSNGIGAAALALPLRIATRAGSDGRYGFNVVLRPFVEARLTRNAGAAFDGPVAMTIGGTLNTDFTAFFVPRVMLVGVGFDATARNLKSDHGDYVSFSYLAGPVFECHAGEHLALTLDLKAGVMAYPGIRQPSEAAVKATFGVNAGF